MDWFILLLAGFAGGFLNALAGGGSFIAMPAMILVGLPPITANASATAALLPGYLASAWRFRNDIVLPDKLGYPLLILLAVIGGSAGAWILLHTNNVVFDALIPWLILFATAFFVIGPWVMQRFAKKAQLSAFASGVLLLLICAYGGYFNGGLGIILLAALALMGTANLQGMNGIKNVISAVLTVIAVIIYALGGKLAFVEILITGIAAIVGGYAGAAFSYAINDKWLRGVIVSLGVLMAIAFFVS